VDIPEFEGQLDPDHFLDWLQIVERVFEYKDISDDKKVKLVALKLRKYASIWWANLGTIILRSPKTVRKSRRSRKLLRMLREFRLWSEASYLKPKISCPVHMKTARFLCIFRLKILRGCLTAINSLFKFRESAVQ